MSDTAHDRSTSSCAQRIASASPHSVPHSLRQRLTRRRLVRVTSITALLFAIGVGVVLAAAPATPDVALVSSNGAGTTTAGKAYQASANSTIWWQAGAAVNIAVTGTDSTTSLTGMFFNTTNLTGHLTWTPGVTTPVVEATNTSVENTASTAHAVALPANIQAGDLLIVLYSDEAGVTSTISNSPPSGWTLLYNTTDGNGRRSAAFDRIATGAEGSSVTLTTTSAEVAAANSYRISDYDSGYIVTATPVSGNSTTPDPPNLAPSGWSSSYGPTLWLAISHSGGAPSDSAPTNYTSGALFKSSTVLGGSGASTASGYRSLAAASENPGTFTLDSTRIWLTSTIAIRSGGYRDATSPYEFLTSAASGTTGAYTMAVTGIKTSLAPQRSTARTITFQSDPTPPAIAWTTPAAAATITTTSYTPVWTVTDTAGSGVGNVGTIRRQYETLAANACGGTWTDDGTQANGTQVTLTTARCYRWTADPVQDASAVKPLDNVGNATSANLTSATVKVDTTAPIVTWTTPAAAATITTTSYTPAWTVVDSETGTTTGTIRRQYETLSANACSGSWTDDGAQTNGGVSTLTTARCYRWTADPVQDASAVTPVNGAGTATSSNLTSTTVKVDTTTASAPSVIASGTGVYQASANATVFFKSGGTGTLTETATSSDAETSIASITWNAISPVTGWTSSSGTDASSPYSIAPTWGTTAASGTQTVFATNGASANSANTTLTITADPTAPTLSVWTTPAANAMQSAISVAATWAEGDGTGSGVASRSLQRQRAAVTTPGSCTGLTFVNDGSATDPGTNTRTDSGLSSGFCYRWQVSVLTDRVGNIQGTTYTSSTVLVDATAPSADFTTPNETTTTIQSSTTYSVAWTETETGSGLATRSLQRQKGTVVTPGSCVGVSYANDGSPDTNISPRSNTSLVSGQCYQWIQTLTDNVGNTAAYTSGVTLIDTTAPSVPSVTATGTGVYQTSANSTIFFKPGGTGTLTETATSADAESGIASVTWDAISPVTGWTGSSGTDASSPYSIAPIWGTTAASGTQHVRATDGATTPSSDTILTITADATAPTLSALLPAAGTSSQVATSVSVSWTETETGSGVAGRALQRQIASATSSSQCASATYANDGSVQNVASPSVQSSLVANHCYRWQLAATDNVGNPSTQATSGMVFIVSPTPPPSPSAPDLTASSDTGSLTPSATTITVRPTSDALTVGTLTYVPSGSSAWNLVDEATLDTSDYVRPGSNNAIYFGFPTGSVPSSDVINSVTIHAYINNDAPSDTEQLTLRDPASGKVWGIVYFGQGAPANQSATLTTRPWDGQPWTATDIAALQAGAACDSFCNLNIYQFWVTVDSTTRTPAGYDTDNITADTTPTFSGTNDPSVASVELYEGATLLGEDITVSSGGWQITASPLGDGSHTITAKAVGTLASQDAFGRSVSSGWGTADFGGAYALTGTAADFNVAAGVATVDITAAQQVKAGLLTAALGDSDANMRFQFDKLGVGGAHGAAIFLRASDVNNGYRGRVVVNPNGTVDLILEAVVSGTPTVIASQVAVLSATPATWYHLRIRVRGANPTTVSAKLWADGSAEPDVWAISSTDSSASLQGTGAVILSALAGSGLSNSPVRYSFDDFAAYDIGSTGHSAASAGLAITVASTGPAINLAPGSDTAPPQLTTAIVTLRPSSDISSSGITFQPSGTTGWNLVNEAVVESAQRVKFAISGQIVFGFPVSGLGTNDHVVSVSLHANISNHSPSASQYLTVRDPSSGLLYDVATFDQSGNDSDNQAITMTTRPWDGQAWTKADVDNLQAGGRSKDSGPENYYINQMWLEVTYDTVAPDATYANDAITSDTTPTFYGTNTPGAARVDLLRDGNVVASDTTVTDGTWSITSTASTDGAHSFSAKAYDTNGILTSTLPALSVTINTVAPSSAPSRPDMTAATDTGTSNTDNITDNAAPSFTGTSPTSGVVRLALADDGLPVFVEAIPGDGNYTLTPAYSLPVGSRSFTAVAYDAAGNPVISSGLSSTITTFLRDLQSGAQQTASVGEAVWMVVSTYDETGQPVADYNGTVTVSASPGSGAVFPDGNTAILSSDSGATGHAFRVLFGNPGTWTLTGSGPGLVNTTAHVTVTATDLSATAPDTAYVGAPIVVGVSAHDTNDTVVPAYNGLLTFTSSDSGIVFGGVDSNDQYRLTCSCADSHPFVATFANTGTQTVTATDEFGNDATVTVNVLAAPSPIGLPSGLAVYTVQFENGHTVDYYFKNTTGQSFTISEAFTTATVALCDPETTSEAILSTPLEPYLSFTTHISDVRCWVADSGQYDINHIIVEDGLGHSWLLEATNLQRFDDIPGHANWTALSAGDPLDVSSVSINSNGNASGTEQAPACQTPLENPCHFNTGSIQLTLHAVDPLTIIGYSFPGEPGIVQWAPKPIVQLTAFGFVPAGTTIYTIESIPFACWLGQPYRNNTIVLQYEDTVTGRDGWREYGLPDPGTPPAHLCDNPADGWGYDRVGIDHGNSDPLDLNNFAKDFWKEIQQRVGDPVDVYSGGQTAQVTDFNLGGLTPALSLTRLYRSDVADMLFRGKSGAHAQQLLFGAGWTSIYDTNLEFPNNHTVNVRDATGYYVFAQDDGGNWIPSNNSTDTLTAISGGWKITHIDGSGLRFDANGRLAAIFDANGRELTLGWTSGKLSSLTDAAGRSASVTTNAAGEITRIDLPGSRYVGYAYDANGYLHAVTDLGGTVLTYTTDVRGRITAVTNANDDVLLRDVFDEHGRVITQYNALNEPTFFNYDDVAFATGGVFSSVNNTALTRTIIDPRSGTTLDCYTAQGLLVGSVDPVGGVNAWTYDASANPIRSVDALGNVSSAKYNDSHEATQTTDALGHVTDITWNAFGNPTTVAGAVGASTTMTYDSGTHLPLTVTTADGTHDPQTATSTYYSSTNLLKTTTQGGATSTYHYDAYGYVDSITDPEGRKTTFATDHNTGLMTSSVDALGNATGGVPGDHTTSYTYDGAGRVLTITDALGNMSGGNAANHTTTYTYDAMGRVKTVSRASGALTTYNYDLAGQLTSTVDKLDAMHNATTSYAYDAAGNLTLVTDAEGRQTTTTYDLAGRATSVEDNAGKISTIKYDAKGRVTKVTDPDGVIARTTYDALDRVTKVTDLAGQDTTYAYDPDTGLLSSVTDPLNHTTSYTYDWLGRQLSVTNAENKTSSVTYNDQGTVASVTDARNKTTSYTYNLDGQLLTVTEPGNSGDFVTTYIYDAGGRLYTRENARGATDTYIYDALGRPTQLTDADSKVWQTFYTNDGQVDHTIDGKSVTASFAYDLAGRLLTVTPTSPTAAITYTYDKTGRVLTMADGNGTTTYGYDVVGRLDSTARGGRTTAETYDDAGRLATVTYPASLGSVTYAYDAAGRPSTITDWDSRVTTYHYDDASRISSVDRPGSLTTTYTYDGVDRPLSATTVRSGVTILSQAWTYDPDGDIATLTDDTGTASFTYDNLDRLLTASYPSSQNYTYTYDQVGNILSSVTPAGTTNYAYDLGDRITSAPAGGTAPTYDNNGNMTTDGSYGGRTYAYDTLGHLTSVTMGGVTTSYTLDGAGNRWSQTTGSTTTTFDLDLFVGNATLLYDGTNLYLPGAPGAGYKAAGAWQNALTDLIGSPIEYVSTSGTVSGLTHYDPYGAPRPGNSVAAGISYAGQYRDGTGLINLRARSYDPVLARFIGRDTFGGVASAPQTGNRYAYASANPLRFTDPSGHFVQAVQAHPWSILEILVSFTPIGFALIEIYSYVTGTDPATGAPIDRNAVLHDVIMGAAIFGGIALIVHFAGPVLRALGRVVGDFIKPGETAFASSDIERAASWLRDVAGAVARGASEAEPVVSVYRGTWGFTRELDEGVNAGAVASAHSPWPIYASKDFRAAEDALLSRSDIPPSYFRRYGGEPDPGVIRSDIPQSVYDATVRSGGFVERDAYKGFSRTLNTNEIQIGSPEAAAVFDRYVNSGLQYRAWWK